jgi:2,4-dienoyl-CoA reductase-like NADH-dependent reductase (Old Yellow Enzyme family)
VPLLLEPYKIRDLTLRNRIWLSPMCQYSCENEDGLPHDWHLVHLGSRAQLGFGLIMSEAAAVTPQGRITAQDAGLWNDEQADAWSRIIDFVHSQGAAFGFQIGHAGRKASTYRGFPGEPTGAATEESGGWETIAPSPVPHNANPTPREMTRADMEDVIEAFVAAVRRAESAGADVLEVHAAHGYLLHEFLSPLANERTDEYGGSFDGRVRFPLEVIAAVRASWPESKPLFVRLSATDWLPGGWDVDQSGQLAVLLKDIGVDLVDCSSGSIAAADIPTGRGYQVPLAAQIRKDSGIATAAVGLILEPKQAEEVLVNDEADAIFLARVALREPGWPLRAAYELGLTWDEAPYPGQYTRARWDAIPND